MKIYGMMKMKLKINNIYRKFVKLISYYIIYDK